MGGSPEIYKKRMAKLGNKQQQRQKLSEWGAKGGATKTEATKKRGFASVSKARRREAALKANQVKRANLENYKLKYIDIKPEGGTSE